MWPIYNMKVTEEVVLPDVFNLNDSVMNKNHRDQAQFSPEKITLGKEKWVCYYLHIRYLLSDRKTNKEIIYIFLMIYKLQVYI